MARTNGTLVNGQPIKKHFLQTNDVIELGKYKLKYVNDQAGKHDEPAGLREDDGAASRRCAEAG